MLLSLAMLLFRVFGSIWWVFYYYHVDKVGFCACSTDSGLLE